MEKQTSDTVHSRLLDCYYYTYVDIMRFQPVAPMGEKVKVETFPPGLALCQKIFGSFIARALAFKSALVSWFPKELFRSGGRQGVKEVRGPEDLHHPGGASLFNNCSLLYRD